ncbi:uncharacterized protein [Diabrotica undecimpunctata]|uniref:uncharacterized protein n=1 Tax=Diabrotica undecimpunctata TaxID=50387 RepID=UPI003B635078
MKLSFHKKNQKTKNILRRASLALIRESIHDTRREIDQINSRLLKLHLILGNTLHPVLWNILDTLSNFRAETNADLTKTKQIKKFERLSLEQQPRETPQQDTCKLVYNFSNFTLDEATKSVLSKGFNFAVAPARIPIENIICEVESSITNIPSDTAETIRQDVSRILRTAKPPKRNITHEEKEALNSLRKNKEIIVLPADKVEVHTLTPVDADHSLVNWVELRLLSARLVLLNAASSRTEVFFGRPLRGLSSMIPCSGYFLMTLITVD